MVVVVVRFLVEAGVAVWSVREAGLTQAKSWARSSRGADGTTLRQSLSSLLFTLAGLARVLAAPR